MSKTLECGRFRLSLKRPLVMGIINVTPDSFSDGQPGLTAKQAIEQGLALVEQGADLLDIGGESSRPGARPVSAQEELSRIMPVIKGLLDSNIPLSVDTTKPEVMESVLDAGVDMINDITGFSGDKALQVVARYPCALCIMHMQGEPRTMQLNPHYDDVVSEVHGYLLQRAKLAEEAGISAQRIVLDPGFGFGKTVAQNYTLLRHLDALTRQPYPVLVGLSRKSMLGHILARPPQERVAGSVAAALAAVGRGAAIVRVHDVDMTADALRIHEAIEYGIE